MCPVFGVMKRKWLHEGQQNDYDKSIQTDHFADRVRTAAGFADFLLSRQTRKDWQEIYTMKKSGYLLLSLCMILLSFPVYGMTAGTKQYTRFSSTLKGQIRDIKEENPDETVRPQGAEYIRDETGMSETAGEMKTASFGRDIDYEPVKEEVKICIPGLDREYRLVWISDMHICTGKGDPDVSENNISEVQDRHEMFRNESGRASGDTWAILSGQIDSMNADYVILGADMVDYASKENYSVLKEGIDKIRTKWMYIRADHDYARWYGDMSIKRLRKLQRSIAPQNKIWVEYFDGFTLVGLDNTTTAIEEETLDRFKEIYKEGKPVILCTHVPFDTGSPDAQELADLSGKLWQDRVLCWGEGDYNDTAKSPAMKELLDMITAPGSPVCAVLSGHLHTSWEGSLTETCLGHVFSAAFEDHIGIITVTGSIPE